MIQLSINSNDNKQQREVRYKNVVIKAFSYYDDFAFTKAKNYKRQMEKLSITEFQELFPEFFI